MFTKKIKNYWGTMSFFRLRRLRIIFPILLMSATSQILSSEGDFIVGQIRSRLGNQMFVIAATLSLAIDNEATAYFPELKTKTINDVPMNREKVLWRLNAEETPREITKIVRASKRFKPIPYENGISIRGQIWTEKYFKHNREKILPLFAPSKEILSDLQARFHDILRHPKSVGVHIRTLAGEGKAQTRRPLYAEDYLDKACQHFDNDSLFVVFSDDITWCKKNLSHLPYNLHFIENEPYYNDFYLMSMCKHNIVSNSTFSWWAAYLNTNKAKKIVAPKLFYYPQTGIYQDDIWPPEWTLVSTNLPEPPVWP